MDHGSEITIDLGAIDHNVRSLRHIVSPGSKVCTVVKANAYGLGAVRIARQLVASGVDMLAVFEPAEAVELFDAGIGRPVLVLMPVWEIARTHDVYRALIRGSVHLTVHGRLHVEQLAHIAEQYAAPISVHLELDTGMRRGGCAALEAAQVLRHIANHRLLRLAGVFTHFACARDNAAMTEAQRSQFESFIREHKELIPDDALLHIANTAATFRGQSFHQSMVRVGVAWAGYGPELITDSEVDVGADVLRPAVRWTSRIVLTKHVEPGETVGYGAGWTAQRRTRLGLVPVGYADGFPMGLRAVDGASTTARLAVQCGDASDWAYAPIVGTLSMDQITIDITDMPGVEEAAAVELFGIDKNAPHYLPAMAMAAGVIPHALLAGLSPLIPRRYLPARPTIDTLSLRAAQRAAGTLGAVIGST